MRAKSYNKKVVLFNLGKRKTYYLYAVVFNLVIGICVFGYFILKEGGLFTLYADFNNQQIPFNILANDAVKSGEIFWNWNIDLGSNFIGAFSFYNLGSPFFWVTLLFPPRMFPYLIGTIYILKYTVAGLTSFMYIQLFIKDKRYAVLASALYAFSGFQAANLLFYHFHDAVAFFPLMLWGVEKLVSEKKRAVFALTVFINALLSYFFFVGEVIFVIVYFLVRFFTEKEGRWKKTFLCMGEGILGTIMASVLLLPSVFFVLSNPRIEEHISGIDAIVFDPLKYLVILRALFFPGENMSHSSCVFLSDFSSCAAYLPMVGIILVIAFILTKPRTWLSKLLIISFITSMIPILGSVFYLFNAVTYHRWYYMPIILMALASAKVLENRKEYKVLAGVIVSLIFWTILTVIVYFYGRLTGNELVFRSVVFGIISLISLAGILLTYFITIKIKNNVFYRYSLYVSIALFCILTTGLNVVLYRKASSISSEDWHEKNIESTSAINTFDEQYRFDNDNNLVTMTVPLSGIGSWNSTVSSGIFEFYEALGLERTIVNPEAWEGTTELLAGKYSIEKEQKEEGVLLQTIETKTGKQYVYENPNTLPIGYTYDTYMTKSKFMELSPELRSLAMIKTLIIPDDKEVQVKQVLREYDEDIDGAISSENKNEDIQQHLSEVGEEFERSTKGFSMMINADSDKYAFFSVPVDQGWSATVNGETSEILNINGLMAVEIHEGNNEIIFTYEVPLLKVGGILSLCGFFVWGVYFVKKRKPA